MVKRVHCSSAAKFLSLKLKLICMVIDLSMSLQLSIESNKILEKVDSTLLEKKRPLMKESDLDTKH